MLVKEFDDSCEPLEKQKFDEIVEYIRSDFSDFCHYRTNVLNIEKFRLNHQKPIKAEEITKWQ